LVVVVIVVPLPLGCPIYLDRETVALAIPVVFLVLPVTVLFAIYPGFTFLRFSI